MPTATTTAFTVLGWAHWGGLALILIGYLMSLAQRVIHPVMVWGARLQLLLGLAMIPVLDWSGGGLNPVWVGVKLVVGLAVVALCEISASRARKGRNLPALTHAAAALTVVNTLYALFF